MPVDQDYVKAMDVWNRQMLINIKDSADTIADCKRIIELNQKKVELEQELFDYNSGRLEKAISEFKDYLKENAE